MPCCSKGSGLVTAAAGAWTKRTSVVFKSHVCRYSTPCMLPIRGLPPSSTWAWKRKPHAYTSAHAWGQPSFFLWGPGDPPTPTMPHPTNFRTSVREALILQGSHHDIQCHHIFTYANKNVCLDIYINIYASCKAQSLEPSEHQWACVWAPLCSTVLHADSFGSIWCLQNQPTNQNTNTILAILVKQISNIGKKQKQYW